MAKRVQEPPPSEEEQASFMAALLAPSKTKTVSDTQDDECFKLLDSLRNGHWQNARRQIEEIERLYIYAGACPSNDGFRNLMHVVSQLFGRSLTADKEPLTNLVAIGEDYDPEARKQ